MVIVCSSLIKSLALKDQKCTFHFKPVLMDKTVDSLVYGEGIWHNLSLKGFLVYFYMMQSIAGYCLSVICNICKKNPSPVGTKVHVSMMLVGFCLTIDTFVLCN